MKSLSTTFIFLFSSSLVFSQAGMWTWVKGDSTASCPVVYGTKGIEDPANTPPGLYEPAEWTDLDGNFWLFGGGGDSIVNNNLWKYNPATNNWTWIKGPGIPSVLYAGSYGVRGVAAMSNLPRARGLGASTWTDSNGDLWLYGGLFPDFPNQVLGDLWKYNIATNMWTWVSGDSIPNAPAVYGVIGVPSAANSPGSRYECSATWVDANNNLWLFGGDNKGDLWRYNISGNVWTCMHLATFRNYGTKGIPAATNNPGMRYAYCSWVDETGNFWLFGGGGSVSSNDMWRYEPATNNWTWMSGTNAPGNRGSYGLPLCTPSTDSVPAARFENRARWKDDCGNFWLYGGSFSLVDALPFSDLWSFNPSTLMWTRINGSRTRVPPEFGVKGLAAPGNTPGYLMGAVGWKSKNGDLFLFGGQRGDALIIRNAMWKFVIDTSCPAISRQTVSFNFGNDTTYCGSFTRILNSSDPNTIWSTGVTAAQITVNTAGTYWARASNACRTASDTIVFAQRAVPNVNLGNDTSLCGNQTLMLDAATPNSTYHWQDNSSNSTLNVSATGIYSVTVTSQDGCTATDSVIVNASNIPPADVTANKNIFCSGDSARVCAPSGYASYQWNMGQTDSCIKATLAGNYYVTVTDNNGCSAESNRLAISVHPLPPVAISINGDTLKSFNAVSYQWYLNGNAISGATSSTYISNQPGSYTVAITDTNGCRATSIPRIISGLDDLSEDDGVSVSQLTVDSWQLTVGNNWLGGVAELFDASGKLVFKSEIRNPQSEIAADVARGVYLLRISSSKGSVVKKLEKL